MHPQDRLQMAQKLAREFHLSVPERLRLPSGRMPLSAIVEAVSISLSKQPFFPPDALPESLGDGAVIERLGRHHFRVHERFEVGVMRYSEVVSRSFLLLRSAVLRYLRHYGPLVIDGVRIDRWS